MARMTSHYDVHFSWPSDLIGEAPPPGLPCPQLGPMEWAVWTLSMNKFVYQASSIE